jgi:hypothetical protein
MRFLIHITTLKEPVRFFATGQTRAEAHAEGLAFIHRWPLHTKNQPCALRIEESHWMFPEPIPQPTEERNAR